MATNVSSRTKFRRLCRVAGATAALIVLAAYRLLSQPPVQDARAYSPSTLGPHALVFFLLLLTLAAASEWAADRFIEGEEFPIAERMFGFLPWLYSLVLGVAGVLAVLCIKEGPTRGLNEALVFSVLFVWFCPHEFPLLRMTVGFGTAVMYFAMWWTTSTGSYLTMTILGIGVAFSRPEFGVKAPTPDEARY